MGNLSQIASRTSGLLLPNPDGDYLGVWLETLADYPGKISAPGLTLYRVALQHLTEVELDLAFTGTARRHPSGYRPQPGEILKYLEEERRQLFVTEKKPTEVAEDLSPEERQKFLAELRAGAEKCRKEKKEQRPGLDLSQLPKPTQEQREAVRSYVERDSKWRKEHGQRKVRPIR